MSWTRLDDNWTRKRRAEGLNFEEIGYLVALIQHCSSTDQFDGRIEAFDARTMGPCSDVDAILGHLIQLGHAAWAGNYLVMLRIMEHLPSEEVRDRAEAERLKKRRQRAHAKGDHSLCTERTCPALVPGTVPGTDEGQGDSKQRCPVDVPGTVGTGQGGPGREEVPAPGLNGTAAVEWPPVRPPGGVDLRTGEVWVPPVPRSGERCGCPNGVHGVHRDGCAVG